MKTQPEWGFRADGRPRTFGDLTRDEQRAVMGKVVAKLQADLDDPRSEMRQRIAAILTSPDGGRA